METRPSIWGECPPKFATKLGRAVVKEGQMGRFSCKITGRPQPQVTWLKVRFLSVPTLAKPGDPAGLGLDPWTSGSVLLFSPFCLPHRWFSGLSVFPSRACSRACVHTLPLFLSPRCPQIHTHKTAWLLRPHRPGHLQRVTLKSQD